MKRRNRKTIEKIIEGVLFSSSTITSITVLFIIIFLFREGIGLFTSKPVESGVVVAVHPQNPINSLTADELDQIFNQDITNWKEMGGANDTILLLSLDNITNYISADSLGGEFEFMAVQLDKFIAKTSGVIAYFPEDYKDPYFHGKIINISNVSTWKFFTGTSWYPTNKPAAQLGALPLILGTLWVSLGAILLALPLGLATAIYLAEVANMRVRNVIKPVIELLAGIPSVVFGFWGLIVVVPFIQKLFNLPVGETALVGSIVLAIMALPTIITIAEDAMRTTPRPLREASLALGASHWQTIYKVVIPYSRSGIVAAIILGIGRAVGETMAVLMVTGNAAILPHSYLQPVRTIPATVAAELGETPVGSVHYQALFALGIILFLLTFSINVIVEFIKRRSEKINY